MILYRDDLVVMEYAAAQDVLVVQLTGQDPFTALDLKQVFDSVLGCTSERVITTLLIDFGKNTVSLTDMDYKELMTTLVVGLMRSAVKKVARVAPQDPVREQKVESVYGEIKAAIKVSFTFQNFSSRAAALEWLLKR